MQINYDTWLQADYQSREADRESWQEKYEELLADDFNPSDWNMAAEAISEERLNAFRRHQFAKAMESNDYAEIGLIIANIVRDYCAARAADAADDYML